MASYKITINYQGGTGSTDAIWYDAVSDTFYTDETLSTPVDTIQPPTRECWAFAGIFSDTSSTLRFIDETGNILDDLRVTRAARTIHARWTRVSYKITLNDNNGAGGSGAIYWKIDAEDDNRLFVDDACTVIAVQVAKPGRSAYGFEGYYNGTSTLGSKYVNADGEFTEAMNNLALTGDKTIYARWISAYKITVSANSGSGGTTEFYFDSVSQKFYDGPNLLNAITAIVPHSRAQYALLGYMASNADAGAMRVNPDGLIADGWIPTAAATIYARWSQVSYKITISKSSGTGGADFFFSKIGATTDRFFSDDLCTVPISSIEPPSRSGHVFKGIYNTSSGTTQYVGRDGSFTDALQNLSVTANKTIYAQWIAAYKITLSKQSGSGGTDALYYDSIEHSFFLDQDLTTPASSVDVPIRECHRFRGFYNSASGTTQYIDDAGELTDALWALSITAAKTFYAQWELVSYKITLNDNNGEGGSGALYVDGVNNAFYSDYMLSRQVSAAAVPLRPGYDFVGYFSTNTTTGGSRYIDATGQIVVAAALPASNNTLYARWNARTYILGFDYNGGQGDAQPKSVTMGTAIGALPSGTSQYGVFDGWYVGSTKLEVSAHWNFPEDTVAVAKWRYYFGNLTDWFDLETPNGPLMLVKSTDGATRSVVETSHAGSLAIQTSNSTVGAFERGGILLNPVCTYRIRKPGNIHIQLGRAWPNVGTTKSGYMLTNGEYSTEADGEPVLVVRGVANEGASAINLWSVNLEVNPDHIAQDPMNSVIGGGELIQCKTLVTCDAVVPMENGMPCASDIVHGKIIVTATTNAYAGENAPAARTPFIETNGIPPDESDVDYTSYEFQAERSL